MSTPSSIDVKSSADAQTKMEAFFHENGIDPQPFSLEHLARSVFFTIYGESTGKPYDNYKPLLMDTISLVKEIVGTQVVVNANKGDSLVSCIAGMLPPQCSQIFQEALSVDKAKEAAPEKNKETPEKGTESQKQTWVERVTSKGPDSGISR